MDVEDLINHGKIPSDKEVEEIVKEKERKTMEKLQERKQIRN